MMKYFNTKSISIFLMTLLVSGVSVHSVLAGLSGGLNPTKTLNEIAVHELVALDDQAMDELRGGFVSGQNIEVSFGFESILKVDGILQTRLSLNIPQITFDPTTHEVTYSSIQATSFKSGNLAEGLTVSVPGSNGATGLELARLLQTTPLIIQNSANNRTIQNIQNFDIAIKGLDPKFSPGLNKILTPSLIDSIH